MVSSVGVGRDESATGDQSTLVVAIIPGQKPILLRQGNCGAAAKTEQRQGRRALQDLVRQAYPTETGTGTQQQSKPPKRTNRTRNGGLAKGKEKIKQQKREGY